MKLGRVCLEDQLNPILQSPVTGFHRYIREGMTISLEALVV